MKIRRITYRTVGGMSSLKAAEVAPNRPDTISHLAKEMGVVLNCLSPSPRLRSLTDRNAAAFWTASEAVHRPNLWALDYHIRWLAGME